MMKNLRKHQGLGRYKWDKRMSIGLNKPYFYRGGSVYGKVFSGQRTNNTPHLCFDNNLKGSCEKGLDLRNLDRFVCKKW